MHKDRVSFLNSRELVRWSGDPAAGCFGKKNMFSCTVGCQPDVPAVVAAYCTYTGHVVFNTLGSIADWVAWLGFEEAACVHQCYIDLFCQLCCRG